MSTHGDRIHRHGPRDRRDPRGRGAPGRGWARRLSRGRRTPSSARAEVPRHLRARKLRSRGDVPQVPRGDPDRDPRRVDGSFGRLRLRDPARSRRRGLRHHFAVRTQPRPGLFPGPGAGMRGGDARAHQHAGLAGRHGSERDRADAGRAGAGGRGDQVVRCGPRRHRRDRGRVDTGTGRSSRGCSACRSRSANRSRALGTERFPASGAPPRCTSSAADRDSPSPPRRRSSSRKRAACTPRRTARPRCGTVPSRLPADTPATASRRSCSTRGTRAGRASRRRTRPCARAGRRYSRREADARTGFGLRVVPADHPLLDPICQIASFYRFAEMLSVALGENPDRPAHLEKITETM